MRLIQRITIPAIGLALLIATGCYSRTVKETTTTPPTVVTTPDSTQSSTTTTTTDPANGEVVRHSTTTYSNQ